MSRHLVVDNTDNNTTNQRDANLVVCQPSTTPYLNIEDSTETTRYRELVGENAFPAIPN